MRNIYTWHLTVRSYEIGRYGHLDNTSFINYLEESAIQASTHVGYGSQWFEAKQLLWVIRKMSVRFYAPVYEGDALECRTWVSDFRRIQSHREYEILRGEERVLRARANWVFMDWSTLRPTRLLPEFEDAYRPSNEVLEDFLPAFHHAAPPPSPIIYNRIAQYHELDKVWHVNNANYIRWTEEATFRALQTGANSTMRIVSHEIEYKQSAQADDPICIKSWRHQTDSDGRSSWVHEISNPSTGNIFALDYLIAQE